MKIAPHNGPNCRKIKNQSRVKLQKQRWMNSHVLKSSIMKSTCTATSQLHLNGEDLSTACDDGSYIMIVS